MDSRFLQKMTETKAHYLGHRERLRDKFDKDSGQSLADYELLEMLLFQCFARGDVKPIAKALLAEFGDLTAVLSAKPVQLQKVKGVGPAAARAICLTKALMLRSMQDNIKQKHIVSSWREVIKYCEACMSYDMEEQFRLLFLDQKNQIIGDEVQTRGTIDQTAIYPREVVKRALEIGAKSIIMVHNHPSGDPSPSREDIQLTLKVNEAAQLLDINLHDHLIIGKGSHASMKSMGLF